LKNDEADAGIPNTLRLLSIPMATAARVTINRNGNMMRVIWTVSAVLPGMVSKPGAIHATTIGAATMPASVIMPTTISRALITRLASRQAAPAPWRVRVCENVVTNAADRAPSAKRSRSRLGMRKAVMNASSSRPAPKTIAKTCSRTRPRMRLPNTARLTTPAWRTITSWVGSASTAIGGMYAKRGCGATREQRGLRQLDSTAGISCWCAAG
jgi:hypothetical protein